MLAPMKSSSHDPRSTTILRHVHGYLLGTSVSEQTYAEDVRRIYFERTPDDRLRALKFHVGGDAADDMQANGQLVGRILSRVVRMPVDLEEALVLALPEERQRSCWVELGARVVRLSVAYPEEGIEGLTADLGRFISDFGELTVSFGPLLSDLAIDEHDDRGDLERALNCLRQLAAGSVQFIEVISNARGRQESQQPDLRRVS